MNYLLSNEVEFDIFSMTTISKTLNLQPLVSSAPLPVRRTSWMNCCGLFEAFSGAASR